MIIAIKMPLIVRYLCLIGKHFTEKISLIVSMNNFIKNDI